MELFTKDFLYVFTFSTRIKLDETFSVTIYADGDETSRAIFACDSKGICISHELC